MLNTLPPPQAVIPHSYNIRIHILELNGNPTSKLSVHISFQQTVISHEDEVIEEGIFG